LIFCQTSILEFSLSVPSAAFFFAVRVAVVTESGAVLSKSAAIEQRETAILDASFKIFTRYGFARSTMDDIAQEAGISRPALYQHFKNKKDIYRAFAEKMTWQMTDGLQAMLAADGPPEPLLNAAFEACVIQPMRQFAVTEHGHELMDMKNDLAADIMAAMLGREHGVLAAFFQRHGQNAASAADLATLMIDALEGAKSRMQSLDGFEQSLCSTIGLIVKLLRI
jgi:AcrR family transcriptional regulator